MRSVESYSPINLFVMKRTTMARKRYKNGKRDVIRFQRAQIEPQCYHQSNQCFHPPSQNFSKLFSWNLMKENVEHPLKDYRRPIHIYSLEFFNSQLLYNAYRKHRKLNLSDNLSFLLVASFLGL